MCGCDEEQALSGLLQQLEDAMMKAHVSVQHMTRGSICTDSDEQMFNLLVRYSSSAYLESRAEIVLGPSWPCRLPLV